MQPAGKRIDIYFDEFNTERCCDKVTIFDGDSLGAPKMGKFSGSSVVSGSSLPGTMQSTGNSIFIK